MAFGVGDGATVGEGAVDALGDVPPPAAALALAEGDERVPVHAARKALKPTNAVPLSTARRLTGVPPDVVASVIVCSSCWGSSGLDLGPGLGRDHERVVR